MAARSFTISAPKPFFTKLMFISKTIIPLFGIVTVGLLLVNIPVYAQAQTIKSFNVPQKVAVAFPITGDRDDRVANGRMRTSFTLTANGNLSAVTNTRTKVKLAGFTGAASVILVDESKQPIWTSGVHSYGVDGCYIGRCNRNENWSETVPPEIMSRVRGYAILQQHDPKWRAFDRGEQFLRWLGSNEGKATVATIATIATMF